MTSQMIESAPSLSISNEAKARISTIMQDQGFTLDSARIRVSVISGGCSGLSYKLDIEEKMDSSLSDKDQVFEVEDLEIVIDMRSYLYLAGTRLEFSDGLNGKGFSFQNPNASRTCSCGESFSL